MYSLEKNMVALYMWQISDDDSGLWKNSNRHTYLLLTVKGRLSMFAQVYQGPLKSILRVHLHRQRWGKLPTSSPRSMFAIRRQFTQLGRNTSQSRAIETHLSRKFTVLAFESSADDTCVAVVNSERKILSNVVVKQLDQWVLISNNY